MDEPTSAEWVIGEWVTLDRELHPFEALELATVIEAVKLHVLHGWPRWWAWTFASLVAQIAIGILEAAATRRCAGSLWVVEWGTRTTICRPAACGRPADRTLMVEPDSAEPVASCPVSWSSAM